MNCSGGEQVEFSNPEDVREAVIRRLHKHKCRASVGFVSSAVAIHSSFLRSPLVFSPLVNILKGVLVELGAVFTNI